MNNKTKVRSIFSYVIFARLSMNVLCSPALCFPGRMMIAQCRWNQITRVLHTRHYTDTLDLENEEILSTRHLNSSTPSPVELDISLNDISESPLTHASPYSPPTRQTRPYREHLRCQASLVVYFAPAHCPCEFAWVERPSQVTLPPLLVYDEVQQSQCTRKEHNVLARGT